MYLIKRDYKIFGVAMALKESTEKVRKKVHELASDMKSTRETLRETVRDIRPKPLRGFVEKKVESIRPLKRWRKEEEQ